MADNSRAKEIQTSPGPAASSVNKKAHDKPDAQTPLIVFFYYFLGLNLIAAIYSPILDCDETYNYWEPTHFLRHGFGLQTWEYSPEYAIRSWLYIALHAMASTISVVLPFMTKVKEFYLLRILLAFACAGCETRLFSAICTTFNRRVGIIFLMAMVSSPGMFHASVAYLPSSFAMYAVMLGMAAFMDWRGGLKTAQGMMWFGIGGIVGWPFACALAIPFLLEEVVLASVSRVSMEQAWWRAVDGTVRCLMVLALSVGVDLFFYHRLTVVPVNIVLYNVFSGASRGPDIFGTEPWDFYLRNLLLNFNLWFILALASLPITLLRFFVFPSSPSPGSPQAASAQTRLRSLVFLSPFYLWLVVFSLQAHKEERFMYPAYPALALNAAIALHLLLSAFGSTSRARLVGYIPAKIKLAIVGVFAGIVLAAGVLRTAGIVTAYAAPIRVLGALPPASSGDESNGGGYVCYGKEWYRFPTSFFLPDAYRAKFIASAFTGLLPGEFSEAEVGFGIWPTWLPPSGMNDRNEEDVGKYVDLAHCDFLVDSLFPNHLDPESSSPLEPPYTLDAKTWETVSCGRLLDGARTTSVVPRSIWVPDAAAGWVPERYRRHWGEFCLLRRRR
ncbi:MAG: mannosyltransferase [Phylliscum demangeonii]|nr:MAG: mannosyltransferase [Phylliscum demangeonii]